MPITRTPQIDDDGSGTTGTIINNAWKTELYNQIDAQADSAPIAVPYAGLFFSGGLVVTAPQLTLCDYIRHGREVHLRIKVDGATIAAGAAVSMGIAGFPWNSVTPTSVSGIASVTAAGWGICQVAPSGNSIQFNRFDFAPWPATTNGAYFYFDLWIQTA